MDALKDRRLVIAAGMGLALVAGLILAFVFLFRGGRLRLDPATSGTLLVETGRSDDLKVDPQRPLRCFVAGKSIGELPLRDCAARNGVATGALDVGLDESGSLAAATGPTGDVTPLPPDPAADAAAATPDPASDAQPPRQAAAASASAGCWRYGDGGWSRLTDDMPLPACVEALYAGQCEPPGEVAYGRWGPRTLRLAGGVVQVSDDNRTFRLLVAQGPGCSIPSAGR